MAKCIIPKQEQITIELEGDTVVLSTGVSAVSGEPLAVSFRKADARAVIAGIREVLKGDGTVTE
jgi:hypothetical protein